MTYFYLALLALLFYLLGKSADLTVSNFKSIAEKLGIKILFLGLILGLMTTLPELGVALNSLAENVLELSAGNLLGGTLVLFCLILGVSALFNREIKTDGDFKNIIPMATYVFLPLFLGLDGKFQDTDGLILIIGYLLILYFFMKRDETFLSLRISSFREKKIDKEVFWALLGIAGVIIASHFIVTTTIELLKGFNVSMFIVGLVIFSLGTNLPEIIIALKSYRRKISELSLNHLLGSAISNPLLLGIFALAKPFSIDKGRSYLALLGLSFLALFLLIIFYHSRKNISRLEGFFLLFIYLLFLISQIVLYGLMLPSQV